MRDGKFGTLLVDAVYAPFQGLDQEGSSTSIHDLRTPFGYAFTTSKPPLIM